MNLNLNLISKPRHKHLQSAHFTVYAFRIFLRGNHLLLYMHACMYALRRCGSASPFYMTGISMWTLMCLFIYLFTSFTWELRNTFIPLLHFWILRNPFTLNLKVPLWFENLISFLLMQHTRDSAWTHIKFLPQALFFIIWQWINGFYMFQLVL